MAIDVLDKAVSRRAKPQCSLGDHGALRAGGVREYDVPPRQSYARLAKRAALMAERYAHAKQFKRMNRELGFLRTGTTSRSTAAMV